jgi:hypothetical protein
LNPHIDKGTEPGASKVERVEAKTGVLARLVGLEPMTANVSAGKARIVEFEITEPVRESTTDVQIDKVLKPFLARMQFRPDHRYYVIREARYATAMKYRLSDEQLGEIGGQARVSAVVEAGVILSAKSGGTYDLSHVFPERLGVMFLPEELAAVSAGLAAGESKLGRVPVRVPLDWVEPAGE